MMSYMFVEEPDLTFSDLYGPDLTFPDIYGSEDLSGLWMSDEGLRDTAESSGNVQETPRRRMSRRARHAAFMKVDWLETSDAHILKVDLPGMKREDVKVTLEGTRLKITGERHAEKIEGPHSWHRLERPKGRFTRKFPLPHEPFRVDIDAIKASFQDGVLTVNIPIKGEPKREVKTIDISPV
ncbi:hypothetical protein KP509_05G086800 [Ceratopteris richardii]|uniref:SHSP domain-containing protein n=1 Tax=Ceratopteris richardii TaxID=49495 RepID=A0A8T2UVY2_CERRI|nr:hypothetical protein KP509_05G086800 [Ceratopteris richardii]